MKDRIGVLALQGDVREHARLLEECGVQAVPIRRPAELTGLAGIVLPGGESTTVDKLARHFGLFEPLQEAIQSGLPAFGSCAGMIMLATEILDRTADQQSLGVLDMSVRRNAFGRQVDSFEAHLDPAPFLSTETDPRDQPPLRAVFIRAPWVERVGPAVEVLATVDSGQGPGRIVAVRQQALLATSFHPEVTADVRVHQLFVRMVRAETGTEPSDNLGKG